MTGREPRAPGPGSILLRMAGLVRPYPVRAAASFVLGIAIVVLATRLPLVLGTTVDHVVGHQRSEVAAGALLFLVLSVGRFACASLRRAIGGSLGTDVECDLRNRIARQVLRLDAEWHDQADTGQLLARASSDVTAIRGFIGFGSVFSLLNVLTVAIAVVQMWLLSPRLTVVTLAFAPMLAIVSLRYNRRAHDVYRRVQERVGLLSTVVEESAVGVQVVKAFGREDLRRAAFAREADALLADNLAATRLRARYGPLLAMLPELSLVAVLWYGGRLVAHRDITLGTLVAVNSYLAMLSAPLESVSELSGMAQRAVAGAARVFQILDTHPRVADRPGAIALPCSAAGAGISLENVSFAYPQAARLTLAAASLEVMPGDRVAVVGDSGAGKSTLGALLSRAYDPASGRVLVDGHDVTTLTLSSVREAVTVVPAEPVLFAASLRENVTLGSPDASDDDIRLALWACAALDFAHALPDGLDTELGERGTTLSGGQRQRVALARALLSRPRLLVLDDALSQLDALTEATVLDRLGTALRDVTVLVMTGRRSNTWFTDRVVMLAAGRVVAECDHDPARGLS